MILIHKESAEIFEIKIKSLVEPTQDDIDLGVFTIGEIALCSEQEGEEPKCSSLTIAEDFELLGWL